jgi:phosphatidyl-myo-inositol alpha-mannosyltransferase
VSRSLRIAMVCPYSLSRPGGVQGQAAGLGAALERRGHRVVLVAPRDAPSEGPAAGDGTAGTGAAGTGAAGIDVVGAGPSVAVPANGSAAPVGLDPRGAARALRAVRTGDVDVVHVHEPLAPLVAPAVLADPTGPPAVVTFHRSGAGAGYRSLRPLARLLVRRVARAVAVSDAARDTAASVLGPSGLATLAGAAARHGGRPGEAIEVLFNGVDVAGLATTTPWADPADRPTVLFLGRHEERKGLSVLLEAVAALGGGTADPRIRLWVAGDGPETSGLRHRWDGLPGVEWLGVVGEEEKRRRLAAADVLCAPSLGGESFGLVLVEGMAAGCVVVASDIDGYRDAAGPDAVLVAPGDPAALAAALGAVLGPAAPDGADGPGPGPEAVLDSASARAERWSMRRLADRYEGIYRDLVVGEAP